MERLIQTERLRKNEKSFSCPTLSAVKLPFPRHCSAEIDGTALRGADAGSCAASSLRSHLPCHSWCLEPPCLSGWGRALRTWAPCYWLVALLALWLLSARPARSQDFDVESVDLLVKEALQKWHVPGAAVAIVQNDRLIYVKGFGVRKFGNPAPITPDTIFPIASCTKTVTSLALAMLVDEGKLKWDDPVRKHVPFFRLADPLADANATLRDLLTHRTGVGAHDLLWYKAPWAFEERIRKIGKVNLDHSFRSAFEYQTILFGTAGYAGGKAAGSDWRTVVEKRIFSRLGMESASCVFPSDSADVASPHKKNAKGIVEPSARYPLDQPDPAGSIHASARELSQFVRFQLGDGCWKDR